MLLTKHVKGIQILSICRPGNLSFLNSFGHCAASQVWQWNHHYVHAQVVAVVIVDAGFSDKLLFTCNAMFLHHFQLAAADFLYNSLNL